MGVACGSSTGSTEEIKAFGNMLLNSVADGLNANSYIRMMPHTTAANISIFFGLKGRLIPTSSACTSGSTASTSMNGASTGISPNRRSSATCASRDSAG